MRRELALLVGLVVLGGSSASWAQVGKPYRLLRVSEFAKAFSLTKTAEKNLEDGRSVLGLEPGKDRDKVDIEVEVNLAMVVTAAELRLERSWLGDARTINGTARDLVVAFLSGMSCDRENLDLVKLTGQIRLGGGAEDKVERTEEEKGLALEFFKAGPMPAYLVFLGEQEVGSLLLSGCSVRVENRLVGEGQRRLEIRIETR